MGNMTPSMMTEGQISKAVSNYRALLEKHSKEFQSGAVQIVLGQSELAEEMFALFRKRVEAVSNLIVRAEVVFFKPDLSERSGYISDDELEKEFELRGLKPADPYSLAAVNEADPTFADEKPNGSHWKDAEGNWCYVAFDGWHGKREVSAIRYYHGWGDGWWFAGVRK